MKNEPNTWDICLKFKHLDKQRDKIPKPQLKRGSIPGLMGMVLLTGFFWGFLVMSLGHSFWMTQVGSLKVFNLQEPVPSETEKPKEPPSQKTPPAPSLPAKKEPAESDQDQSNPPSSKELKKTSPQLIPPQNASPHSPPNPVNTVIPNLDEGFISFFEPDVLLGSIVTRELPLSRFLREMGREKKVNIIVDETLDIRVTLELSDPKTGLNQLLNILTHLFPISCERVGNFVYVRPSPKPDIRNDIVYDHRKDELGFDLHGMKLADLTDSLIEITGKNVFYRKKSLRADRIIRGYQARMPFEEALEILVRTNNLGLKTDRNTFTIGRVPGVVVNEGRIDAWFEGEPLKTVLHNIAESGAFPLLIADTVEGEISVDVRDMPLEHLLRLLLANTDYSYNFIDGVHVIGKDASAFLKETAIVNFRNVHVGIVPSMIPEPLKEGVEIVELKEYNSLMLMGDPVKVGTLRQLATALDQRVPQVLLEVVVVEFTSSDLLDVGLNITTGNDQQLFPELDLTVDGFRREGNKFTITRLPSNFSVKLHALQKKGIARVITKPHIAALSGNEASLLIGSTLFYRINSENIVGTDNPQVSTTQKIESVEANTHLKITPWVIDHDMLTVDITTEFNTFGGVVEDNVPPALNVSAIESMVRLRDGETIILGGLILNSQTMNREGLPFLSRVPVVGALFRNRMIDTSQRETIVYITPHIFYGDPDSAEFIRDDISDHRIKTLPFGKKKKKKNRKDIEAEKYRENAPFFPPDEGPVK